MLWLDSQGISESPVDGVARSGEEDRSSRLTQHSETSLQRSMSPTGQENVLKIQKVLGGLKL